MSAVQITCWSCAKTWEFHPPMARGESCEGCGWDARVCKNCRFFDPRAYRECIEEQAELVKDKDKRNFCSYFEAKSSSVANTETPKVNPLDQLFGGSAEPKKKSKLEEELESFFKK